MNDSDRLLSSATNQGRILADGCAACNGSKVLCRCITWIEGEPARCCSACSHGAGE